MKVPKVQLNKYTYGVACYFYYPDKNAWLFISIHFRCNVVLLAKLSLRFLCVASAAHFFIAFLQCTPLEYRNFKCKNVKYNSK